MTRILLFLGFALLAPAAVLAQSNTPVEIGTSLGVGIVFDGHSTLTLFGAPGGGLQGTPSLYATVLASNLMLEPRVGFSLLTGGGHSVTSFRLGEQVGYLFTPEEKGSPYVLANLGQFFGTDMDAQFGIGGGIGYRLEATRSLAVRWEALYRRWLTSDGYNEVSIRMGLGAVIR